MPPKPLIQVIGSLNIDFVTLTSRVPGPGETLTATSLSVNAGGKGANQAVGCGRAAFTSESEQDVNVEMIGAVGVDDPYYASLLRPTLEKSGVDVTGISEIKNSQTGTATILVETGVGGQNRILIVPGANHDGMNDVDHVLKICARDRNPDVVVMQGEIPRDTVLGLLKHFNSSSNKTQIVLNPAPVFPEGIPTSFMDGLAVLVVNETESVQLSQSLQDVPEVSVKDVDNMNREELSNLANQFHGTMNVVTVLITLGGKGVYYSTKAGTNGLVPAAKVEKVVDTTAAGDTFVGYIATALARSGHDKNSVFDIAAAVAVANAAAGKCVQKSGAMQSIPYGYE